MIDKYWSMKLYQEATKKTIFDSLIEKPNPTKWQHFIYPFKCVWWRIRDAWMVLAGKAEIERL